MRKIGILTYHSSDNYGSVLQAYALQKYLSSFCDAQIVDYRKTEVKELYKIFKPMNSKFNIITNFYSLLYYKKLKKRKKAYEEFRHKFINLSENEINTKEELDKFVKRYDAMVCGSDQVWNFDILDFDTSYLLDFPEFTGKKIAYAASMGPKQKSLEQVSEYKEMFEDFDEITARENSVATVLEKVLKKRIDTVIDPVFLLSKEEWEEALKQGNISDCKGDYVFCYFPGGVSKHLERFSVELAKKTNSKRVLVVPEWRNLFRTGKKMYDCMPLEFVSMIKNAKAVCTDSFHGTAFSIIMDTPLFVEVRNGATDSRINTLLAVAKKESCIINQYNSQYSNNTELTLEQDIDYSKKILSDLIK